jgi:stage II sporulation protein M
MHNGLFLRIRKTYSVLLFEARWYILGFAVLAVVWTLIGYMTIAFWPGALPYLLARLEATFHNLLGDLDRKSDVEIMLALLRQNSTATAYDLLLGFVFGIFPVVSIAFNFFALGFLFAPSILPSVFPEYPASITTFALGIIPHGLFELPAIILAAAFGFRLGWLWLLPQAAGRRLRTLGRSAIDCIAIAPLIFILLVIAAFVEAFVTSKLV